MSINFEQTDGLEQPPLAREDRQVEEARQDEIAAELEGADKARQGKVPLHPAAIRFPMSVSGRMLAELSGFDGWEFTPQELDDLVEIWSQLDIQVSPTSQAILATATVFTLKAAGYVAWVRQGKPAPEARNRSAKGGE